LPEKNLTLKDTMILFDRDLGLSVFQNFRGYNNLTDDAEWLLERTSQKSRGFLIRPMSKDKEEGVWIGEYDYGGSQINRQELIFSKTASVLSRLISDYADHKITEKKFMKKIAINSLKKKLKSRIVHDFRYYVCPPDFFYRSCTHIDKVYEELTRKYGKGSKIPYMLVVEEIAKTKPCEDVIVCPLIVPNSFEGILNLDKALKSRKLGEVKLITSDMVKIV
jgi:hypothetical protein